VIRDNFVALMLERRDPFLDARGRIGAVGPATALVHSRDVEQIVQLLAYVKSLGSNTAQPAATSKK